LTFRNKLALIATTAALTLMLVIGVSKVLTTGQLKELADVRGRLVPKLSFGPQLEAEFQRMRQALQDAGAAQERSSLETARESRERIFGMIAQSGAVLAPEQAAALRWGIEDFYQQGRRVAERSIAGDSGEAFVEEMDKVRRAYLKTEGLIQSSTQLQPNELTNSFDALEGASVRAERLRLMIAVAGVLVVVALLLWVGGALVTGLAEVSRGLARFATGNFDAPIRVNSKDELANVARDANAMAESLRTSDQRRRRDDWLREGSAGLSDELRGELEPDSLAARALLFLVRRLGAQAGGVYLSHGNSELRLVATHAWPDNGIPIGGHVSLGTGLVGQAALHSSIEMLTDLPRDYLRLASGLCDGPPSTLLLMPLPHAGGPVGVVELAFFRALEADELALLEAVAGHLAVALAAAQSYARQRALLDQTQEQAARLGAQEEELRLNNQELVEQQEELQATNSELELQRQALRDQNVELEQARHRLQEKADEVARVSSYKSQFLANMSHELRTPLNSMLLLSHMLSENEAGNLTSKQVEHCKTIHGAGKDLLTLINQVLDLAKIESGKQELHVEATELRQFAAHARRVFQPLADEKGLQLIVEIEPGLPEQMTTDRKQVEGILTNLLGNAVKFTERGSVALRIGRPAPNSRFRSEHLERSPCIAFTVIDTGAGIPADAIEKVFQPFEQLDGHANRRYAGTGLGLAIAREAVNLLKGELQLESEVGRGSVFTCIFPEQLNTPTSESHGVHALAPHNVQDDRNSLEPGEPHLLIIEDDDTFAEQLVDIIHARNLKAVVASSGEDGLRLAKRLLPRGIVLDVKLPDIDGWTVVDRLRANEATRNLPVHFVSGIEAPERGLALGAIGYLTKPASHADLAGMVRAFALTGRSEPTRVLIVEDDEHAGYALLETFRSEGVKAELARDAKTALESIEQGDVGCIVLDLGLPDMDGLSLIENLRSKTHIQQPRIVVHTGRALTKKETRQLEAYSESVILKDEASVPRLLEQIRLFVRHVSERHAPAPPKRAKSLRPTETSLTGTKILLAEDDMRTVYALSAFLQGKGAEVFVAENGREAVAMADEHPDIRGILMDIMMPEMDGYEAMRKLRSDARFAKLPMVALTARAMKGERERCLDAGASDYLSKPVEHEALLEAVRAWPTVRGV
jgi:CheY-like chemotaxis protein/signal transduction histidine kinase